MAQCWRFLPRNNLVGTFLLKIVGKCKLFQMEGDIIFKLSAGHQCVLFISIIGDKIFGDLIMVF